LYTPLPPQEQATIQNYPKILVVTLSREINHRVVNNSFRDENGVQRRISTKETDRKKAQTLADECEKVSRTKRSLRQAQAVFGRLHEELSGERLVRISLRPMFGRLL
jgi:hypothetical protein